MSKKKHDPVKSLNKAFHETVRDSELQDRYNGFKNSLEHHRGEHNTLVDKVNSNLRSIRKLNDAILSLAMEGVLSSAATKKVISLESENEDLIKNIETHSERLNYYSDLIKKYEDLSEHKLFTWWQALVAADPETKPWLEWKETYRDKIV